MTLPTTMHRSLLSRGARSLLSRLRSPRQREAERSAEVWNSEYASGRWAYLSGLSELSRYSILVGYIAHFRPEGAILDVGCGEGVLHRRVRPLGYSRYVGIDLSSNAIAKLEGLRDGKSVFVVADGERYVPTEQFDVIVFNEVLNYFRDPQGAVENYVRALTTGGVILVSTCTQVKGGPAILRRLSAIYPVLDETRVTHGAHRLSWIVAALAPP
jgi:SAM-dependent methyltransferase